MLRLGIRRCLAAKSPRPLYVPPTLPLSTVAVKPEGKEVAAKQDEVLRKGQEDTGGIPWGFIFVLSFIGSVAALFYRGSRKDKDRKALENSLMLKSALAPEEVTEIRRSNNLTSMHYETLYQRARRAFDSPGVMGRATLEPEHFFRFCGAQLGGEFARSGGLKAAHLYERLSLTMPQTPSLDGGGGRVSLDVLLCATSMAVNDEPDETIASLFECFADACDLEGAKRMTSERLLTVIEGLMRTDQLPTRCLVREINEYPLNSYLEATPLDIIQGAYGWKKSRGKNDAVQYPDWDGPGTESSGEKDDSGAAAKLWTLEQFTDVLVSKSVCVWGECNSASRRNK